MKNVAPMTVTCPTCGTGFPIDPDRVPIEGVLAICSVCSRAFRVERPAGWVRVPPSSEFDAPEVADADFEAVGEPIPDLEPHEDFETVEEIEAVEGIEAVEEVEAAEEPVALEAGDEPEALEAVEEPMALEAGDQPVALEEPEVVDELAIETELEGDAIEAMDADPAIEAEADADAEPAVEAEAADDPQPAADAGPGAGRPDAGGEEVPATGAARFGFRDPANRARRLARVLSSDMITYNPARYADARRNGSLRDDFKDEIEKSWEEYVDQVGEEFASRTNHFTDALNEVLAQGENLFEGPGFPY